MDTGMTESEVLRAKELGEATEAAERRDIAAVLKQQIAVANIRSTEAFELVDGHATFIHRKRSRKEAYTIMQLADRYMMITSMIVPIEDEDGG